MSGIMNAPDTVAAAINKDLFKIECARAQHHHNGTGLGNGVHVDATLAVLPNLNTEQYNFKCLLENILAASMWSASRISVGHRRGCCSRYTKFMC